MYFQEGNHSTLIHTSSFLLGFYENYDQLSIIKSELFDTVTQKEINGYEIELEFKDDKVKELTITTVHDAKLFVSLCHDHKIIQT